MGSLTPDPIRFPTSWFATYDNDDLTMPSYSYETSFTSEFSTSNTSSTSSSSSSKMSRASSVSSELDELLYQSLNMTDKDKGRLFREFYCPPRISASGNYYPRYKVQGDSQTGTSHVSYLARPYFSYLVPSCYSGYSKYVYITKLNWCYNWENTVTVGGCQQKKLPHAEKVTSKAKFWHKHWLSMSWCLDAIYTNVVD